MTTYTPSLNPALKPSESHPIDERAWVVDILHDDQLQLANGKRLEPYGRATLSPFVKRLMWSMRIYVIASFFLIAAQLAISLNAQQASPSQVSSPPVAVSQQKNAAQ